MYMLPFVQLWSSSSQTFPSPGQVSVRDSKQFDSESVTWTFNYFVNPTYLSYQHTTKLIHTNLINNRFFFCCFKSYLKPSTEIKTKWQQHFSMVLICDLDTYIKALINYALLDIFNLHWVRHKFYHQNLLSRNFKMVDFLFKICSRQKTKYASSIELKQPTRAFCYPIWLFFPWRWHSPIRHCSLIVRFRAIIEGD